MERFGAKPNFGLASYLLLRVSHRKLVYGNGMTLTWAPDGSGWPREGTD